MAADLRPDQSEAARDLAHQWHRRAESARRHNGLERNPVLQAKWEAHAAALTECAEALERIVGEADPF